MWNRLVCVTPAQPIVALEVAKDHLDVDGDHDDAMIERLVLAAQATIEGPRGIGVAAGASTWRASLDAWPLDGVIRIPLRPVTSIVSISYVDTAGATQTLLAAAEPWIADLDRTPAIVVPPYAQTWPVARCQPGAIKVTFTAGDVSKFPDLAQAALLMLSDWYDNRGSLTDVGQRELPQSCRWLLDRYGPAAV